MLVVTFTWERNLEQLQPLLFTLCPSQNVLWCILCHFLAHMQISDKTKWKDEVWWEFSGKHSRSFCMIISHLFPALTKCSAWQAFCSEEVKAADMWSSQWLIAPKPQDSSWSLSHSIKYCFLLTLSDKTQIDRHGKTRSHVWKTTVHTICGETFLIWKVDGVVGWESMFASTYKKRMSNSTIVKMMYAPKALCSRIFLPTADPISWWGSGGPPEKWRKYCK